MRALLLPAGMLVLLASCAWGSGGNSALECRDNGDCTGTAVCDQSTFSCQDVECLTSDDCQLGSHCDTGSYSCVSGCAVDDDCLAGQSCDGNGQCQAYGCRTTALDCSYGEICQSDGTCVHDTDPNCAPANTISERLTCVSAGGVPVCFGTISNNQCSSGDAYCLLPCTSQDSCPRGTECSQGIVGQSTTYCTGDCPYLIAHGF